MRSYDQLVKEGREVIASLTRNKWLLGDLAIEAVPASTSGSHDGNEERLRTYAEDIGEKPETLRQYRRVAAAWPSGRRLPDVSWSVHQELAGQEDRFKRIYPGLTVDEARRMRGAEPTRHSPPPRTTQEKVESVREALSDPDVAASVAADRDTRERFDAARDHAVKEEIETRNLIEGVDENVLREGKEDRENTQVRRAVLNAVLEARRAVRLGTETVLDDSTKRALREGADAVTSLAGNMRDLAAGVDDVSLAAAVEAWASGEVS